MEKQMKGRWLSAGLLMTLSGCILKVGPTIPAANIPSDAPAGVRVAIEKLYSPDAAFRCQAAADLAEMGARAAPAVPFLASMLDDRGSEVERIVGAKVEPAKTRFLDSLTAADVRVHWYVSRTWHPNRADVVLTPGDYAAEALRTIGRASVPALITALRSKRTGSLERTDLGNAAWALGEIRDERAVQPLIDLLADLAAGPYGERAGYSKLEAAIPRYVATYGLSAGVSAIAALGKLKDGRAVEPLVRMLEMKLVAEVAEKRSSEKIVAMNDVLVRDDEVLTAIEVLGELGDLRAMKALTDIASISKFADAAKLAAKRLSGSPL
jgi:hypothetical protein